MNVKSKYDEKAKLCYMKAYKKKAYKNCLEAIQPEIKVNYLAKIELTLDSLKKDHKQFIRNNKLTLKIQQRFRKAKDIMFLLKKLRRLF